MFEILFAWPDELPSVISDLDALSQAAIHIRLCNYRCAESILLLELSSLNSSQHPSNYNYDDYSFNVYFLLFWLYKAESLFDKSGLILVFIETNFSDSKHSDFIRLLQLIQSLDTVNVNNLSKLSSDDWVLKSSPIPPSLYFAEYLLLLGHSKRAFNVLATLPDFWKNTFEFQLLRAKYFERTLSFNELLNTLLYSVKRYPHHRAGQRYLLYATVFVKSHEHTLPSLRFAIQYHSEHPDFYSHLCRIALLQFRSADARRYCLLDRLSKLTSIPDTPPFATNLWVTQERLGYSSWLEFLQLDDYSVTDLPFHMLEPLMLQNASINGFNSLSKRLLKPILSAYKTQNSSLRPPSSFEVKSNFAFQSSDPLTIAWISADVNHHPVARFLYGYFSAASNLNHRHILVDVNDHGSESIRHWFEDLDSLDVVNYGCGSISDRINHVRSLSADIAIDLNGWTGGNLLRGFYARLAPVQVNYLGYFASTGLKEIDYWLGDSALFSDTFSDFHSEALYRLKRCFIAWQPADPLPEASLDVVSSSCHSSIAFGSFNHNRKLSNSTLKLWGSILESVPGSILVLKAGNKNDPATQELLRRRMLKNGLDADRVKWLPRASTPIEHLNQYSFIDIALDCFPNGGCTTTCEALWMGVPVITLSGSTYASCMSTAVLLGAGLSDWVVSSQQEYLNLAISQADSIAWLRENRDIWRHFLISNPLGRADLLMNHLESAFTDMFTSSK